MLNRKFLCNIVKKIDIMTKDSSSVVVDTIKAVGGIIGVQATQAVAPLTQTDIGHLVADILTGLIAFLTLANLFKSLFFTKKQ